MALVMGGILSMIAQIDPPQAVMPLEIVEDLPVAFAEKEPVYRGGNEAMMKFLVKLGYW